MTNKTTILDIYIALVERMDSLIVSLTIIFLILFFRKEIKGLINVVLSRIKEGSTLRTPIISIESVPGYEKISNLQYAEPSAKTTKTKISDKIPELNNYRKSIYNEHGNIFLTHVLSPSKIKGQKYDIYIYLKGHFVNPTKQLYKVEFYFGKKWGDKVFEDSLMHGESFNDGVFGIKTSAYGPFLAVCKLYFNNREPKIIYRYIDFEMGNLIYENIT